MINVPHHLQSEVEDHTNSMTFDQAADTMRRYGKGDLLKGLEDFRTKYLTSESDDWMSDWAYEIAAYNMAFSGFQKLFHG
jgi:hypothetical protein